MKRECPVCNSEFDGRIDKKFCCDQCRNTFNNQQNQDLSNYSRNINRILKKNRKILSEQFNKGKYKTSKSKLIELGFKFDYLTNIYRTKTNNTYHFCYDYGYIISDNEMCTIVERKEYVN